MALVDEQLARRFWPNDDPIGKRITRGDPDDSTTTWIEIVGMVGHAAHEGLDAEARVQLYFPLLQVGPGYQDVVVRTRSDPESMIGALRAAVQEVDAELPLTRIATMERLIDESFGPRRFSMTLLVVFAVLALVLASTGIYGVMSYSVAQRTHEMGLRMALGARRGGVVGLVMRQGLTLVLIGSAIGLAGAFALTRVLSAQLFGVEATDPVTYVVVTLILIVVSILASAVPATRATGVDPVVALRSG